MQNTFACWIRTAVPDSAGVRAAGRTGKVAVKRCGIRYSSVAHPSPCIAKFTGCPPVFGRLDSRFDYQLL